MVERGSVSRTTSAEMETDAEESPDGHIVARRLYFFVVLTALRKAASLLQAPGAPNGYS